MGRTEWPAQPGLEIPNGGPTFGASDLIVRDPSRYSETATVLIGMEQFRVKELEVWEVTENDQQ
jgi:hypothetical protein